MPRDDDWTPVDPGRETIQIREEGCAYDGKVYVYTIRRGRATWQGRGECESCAESNAHRLYAQFLADRCTEDKRARRRAIKEQ